MAYTLITTTALTNNTNALFQAWGSQIANAVSNCGLVPTSDTGQVDWSTVAAPTAVGQVAGYNIWRFNDALQSVAPVYLKLGYGAFNTAAYMPRLWFAIGNGSDGNGNLTGITMTFGNTTFNYMGTGYQTSTAYQTYYSGDVNRFTCVLSLHRQYGAWVFSVERTVDANGNPTTDGVLVSWNKQSSYTTPMYHFVYMLSTGPTRVESTPAAFVPASGTSSDGTNSSVYPYFHSFGPFLNPGLNMLVYYNDSFTANTPTTLSFYGNTHTYMPIGNSALFGPDIARRSLSGNNAHSLMIRWD